MARLRLPGWRGVPSTRRGGRFRLWPLLLFAVFAAIFWFTNQETVPITGRSQLVEISQAEEAALGLDAYHQVLAGMRVATGGATVDAVRDVGARLAAVAEDPGFNWEFNVVESDEANAFALPGGKVAVYTGILPIAQNVDGLAVIMGHEIAHAIARHGAERMAQQKLADLGTLAAGMSVGEMDPQTQQAVMAAIGLGARYGFIMPFSRQHESEADRIGLIFVARACFDPREAPLLWARMAEAGQGGPPEFLSTHPSHETRIAQFEDWMPEAMAVREEYCGE